MTTIGGTVVASVERAPWGWALTFSVIVALIKGWPAIADAALKAKMALGDRRVSRIEKLESKIEEQRASYEAEIGILRHDLNNVRACFDMLLALIEAAPEKASEHVARIKAIRDKQDANQTTEKAAIKAARIIAASGGAQEAEA